MNKTKQKVYRVERFNEITGDFDTYGPFHTIKDAKDFIKDCVNVICQHEWDTAYDRELAEWGITETTRG